MATFGNTGVGTQPTQLGTSTSGGFQGFSGFGANQNQNLETVQGLMALAQAQGGAVGEVATELLNPQKSLLSQIGSGFKEGFSTLIDVISIPSQTVAGIIDPERSIGEAIEDDVFVSDVLLGPQDPDASGWDKVASFLARTSLDILTDPLTYLTFGGAQGILGLRSSLKVPELTKRLGERTGHLLNVNKQGQRLVNAKVKNQVEGMRHFLTNKRNPENIKRIRNIASNTGRREGLSGKELGKFVKEQEEIFKQGGQLGDMVGKELDAFVDSTVSATRTQALDSAKMSLSNLMLQNPKLGKKYLDQGGIKFFGKSIVSGERIGKTIGAVPGMTTLDQKTRNIRNLLGGAFKPNVARLTGKELELGFSGKVPEEVMREFEYFKGLKEQEKVSAFVDLPKIREDLNISREEDELIRWAIENNVYPADQRLSDLWTVYKGVETPNSIKNADAAARRLKLNPEEAGAVKRMVESGEKRARSNPHFIKNAKNVRQRTGLRFEEVEFLQRMRQMGFDVGEKGNAYAQYYKTLRGTWKRNLTRARDSGSPITEQTPFVSHYLVDEPVRRSRFNKAGSSQTFKAEQQAKVSKFVDYNRGVTMLGIADDPRIRLTPKLRARQEREIVDTYNSIVKRKELDADQIRDEMANLALQVRRVFQGKSSAEFEKLLQNVPVKDRENFGHFLEVFSDSITDLDVQKMTAQRAKDTMTAGVRNPVQKEVNDMSEEALEALKKRIEKGEAQLPIDIDEVNKALQNAKPKLKQASKKKGGVDGELSILAKKLRHFSKQKRIGTIKSGLDDVQLSKYIAALKSQFEANPEGAKGILDQLIGSKQKLSDVLSDIELEKTIRDVNLDELPDAARFFEDSAGNIFERVRASVEDAEAVGFNFDKSGLSTAVRSSWDTGRVAIMKDFSRDLAQKFGRPVSQAPEGYRTISMKGLKEEQIDFSKFFTGKNGEELAFHPATAKKMEDLFQATINDDPTKDMLNFFDKAQGLWKSSVTSIFPAFHGRNAISNVLLSFADIGIHALNPTNHIMAADMIKKEYQLSKLTRRMLSETDPMKAEDLKSQYFDIMNKDAFTDRFGNTYSFGEMRSVIKENKVAFNPNLIGAVDVQPSAEMATELFPDTTAKGIAKKRALQVLPVTREFKGFQWGHRVGNLVEEESRLMHFIANLRGTGDMMHAASRSKQFLFDYTNLTEFERTVMRRIFPFYSFCVPEESEILTRDGWKKYHNLKEGDEVLSLNLEKGRNEWDVVKEIYTFEGDYELQSISNKRGYEFLATQDHRWPVQTSETNTKGKDYGGDYKIKRGYELNTNDRLILAEETELPGNSILSVKEAAVLGWLVTDGYFRYKGRSLEAMIYQSPTKYADEVRDLLGDWLSSESVHPDSGVICFRIKTKKLGGIRKHFTDKDDMPSIVTRLDRESLKAMKDAMFKAEGCVSGKNEEQGFSQKEGPVIDAFQIACQLMGESFNIRGGDIKKGYVRNGSRIKISSSELGTKSYSGVVWCPVTKNGTWIMRQNGNVVATGNSRKNLGQQMETLLTAPGRTAAQFTALTTFGEVISDGGEGLTDEQNELLPEWLKTGINILAEKKGESLQIFGGLETPIEQPFDQLQPNNIMGSLSPLIQIPGEQLTGYDIFRGQPLSETTNAAAFKNAPKALQDFVGFTEVGFTNDQGEKKEWFVSLRPRRMHLILNLPPTSRVFTTIKQLQNENIDGQYRLLQQLTGIRPYDVDLEEQERRREKELRRRLEDMLDKAGVVQKFERTFIPD